MKFNKWTLGLAAIGVVSLASAARADETLSPVQTALSSTTISGYLDFTASWKPGTGSVNMPGRVYDGGSPGYAQDGFNLNVVSLTLDKPLDEGSWSSGYHIQALLGPGAAKRGTGLFGGTAATTDIAFNEAYIALRVPVGNGIDLKVGQFGTYNGYEAYDTYKNPNWSRSYGFFMESSAHTGISASYKVNDIISVMAGVGNIASPAGSSVNGLSSVESSKGYLGMVTLTAPESFGFLKGATLTGGYTGGSAAGFNSPRVDQFYAGTSIPLPVTGLALGLAYDYTADQFAAGSYANATAVYLTYALDKWTFANRVDYTSATAGYFYATAPGGTTQQFVSETFTVGYALWKNVITRAEFRWDHTLAAGRPFGGTVAAPAPNEKNAISLALNVIYQF